MYSKQSCHFTNNRKFLSRAAIKINSSICAQERIAADFLLNHRTLERTTQKQLNWSEEFELHNFRVLWDCRAKIVLLFREFVIKIEKKSDCGAWFHVREISYSLLPHFWFCLMWWHDSFQITAQMMVCRTNRKQHFLEKPIEILCSWHIMLEFLLFNVHALSYCCKVSRFNIFEILYY